MNLVNADLERNLPFLVDLAVDRGYYERDSAYSRASHNVYWRLDEILEEVYALIDVMP